MDRNAATFTRHHDCDPDTDEQEPDSIDAIRLSIEYLRDSMRSRSEEDVSAELTRISDRLAAVEWLPRQVISAAMETIRGVTIGELLDASKTRPTEPDADGEDCY